MKKPLLLLALFPVVVMAQEYLNRAPYPSEERRIAGLSEHIQNGPRYGILKAIPNPDSIITNVATNSILLIKSTSALTNAHLQLQNPTNNPRLAVTVVAVGNMTVTLTTSNLTAANSVGPGFDSMTNVTASTYVIPTNSSATVISTGTNYFVLPGTK